MFRGDKPEYLQVHGTVIRDPDRVLLVLNDVTRLKRLEEIRKEFVANVSHELKTPVTSILGFVETLKEGALDDRERPAQVLRPAH